MWVKRIEGNVFIALLVDPALTDLLQLSRATKSKRTKPHAWVPPVSAMMAATPSSGMMEPSQASAILQATTLHFVVYFIIYFFF